MHLFQIALITGLIIPLPLVGRGQGEGGRQSEPAICSHEQSDRLTIRCKIPSHLKIKHLRLRYRCRGTNEYNKKDFVVFSKQAQVQLSEGVCRDTPLEYFVAAQEIDGKVGALWGNATEPFDTSVKLEPLPTLTQPSLSLRERGLGTISRGWIEAMGARTLLDILRVLPGVFVSRDVQGFEHPSVRGFRDDARIALIVDGVRFYDAYSGRAVWDIPAMLIERLEISYYPPTIVVQTRQKQEIDVRVFGGSFDARSLQLAVGKKTEKFESYFNASVWGEDGPKLKIERDQFSGASDMRNQELMVTHAERFSTTFGWSGDALVHQPSQLRLFGNAFVSTLLRGAYIGMFDVLGPKSQIEQLFWNARAGLRFGENEAFEFAFFTNQNQSKSRFQITPDEFFAPDSNGDGDPDYFEEGMMAEWQYQIVTFGAKLRGQFDLPMQNRLALFVSSEFTGLPAQSFVFQMNRSIGDANFVQNSPCQLLGRSVGAFGACRLSSVVGVSDLWRPIPEIELDFGLKLISFSDIEFDWLANWSPYARTNFQLGQGWSLGFSFAYQPRPPTLEERLDETARALVDIAPGQFVGNDKLKSEILTGLDGRLSYQNADYPIHFAIEAVLFFQRLSQAIERIDATGYVNQLQNYPGYDGLGSEVNFRATMPKWGFAFFNLSWFRSYWREQCTPFATLAGDDTPICKLITHVPQLMANLGVQFEIPILGSLYFATEFASERRNNVRSELERRRPYRIMPTALLNLSFKSQPIFRYLRVYTAMNNLLNLNPQDDPIRPDHLPGLIPKEGFSIYLGLGLES